MSVMTLQAARLFSILNLVKIRFYLDPVTGLPHIHSHGVEEGEVEDVFDKSG